MHVRGCSYYKFTLGCLCLCVSPYNSSLAPLSLSAFLILSLLCQSSRHLKLLSVFSCVPTLSRENTLAACVCVCRGERGVRACASVCVCAACQPAVCCIVPKSHFVILTHTHQQTHTHTHSSILHLLMSVGLQVLLQR